MKEKYFKICIEGEGVEEKANSLSDFIEKELKWKPVHKINETLADHEGERIDLATTITLVLAIPSAILAICDLVERLKRKKKKELERLIQWGKNQPFPIIIITPQGTAIHLQNADSGEILDAANKNTLLIDEKKGDSV